MTYRFRVGDYETTHLHDENPWGRIIADWRVEGERSTGLLNGEGEVIISLPNQDAKSGTITIMKRTFTATEAISFAEHIITAAKSTRVSQSESDTDTH